MVKLVDTRDLKSRAAKVACRFDPGSGHHPDDAWLALARCCGRHAGAWRCVHPTIVRTVLRNTIYAAAGWRSSASFQEHSFSLHLHLRLRSVPAGARPAGPPSLIVTGASPLRGRLDDGASARRPDPHRLAIPPRRSHRRRTSGAGRRALCQARASAQTAALECSAPCAGPPSAALQSRK